MNLKQHRFVTEYLKWGDAQLAYKKAYDCKSNNNRAIESATHRLLRHPDVAQAIAEAEARLRAEAEMEVRTKLAGELLTVQRKREILARIAEGNIYIEQQYKGGNCRTCTQMVKPSIDQMLKAIDLDSRLAGDYPVKKQLTVVHTIAAEKPHPEKQIQATTIITQTETPALAELTDNGQYEVPQHITHAGLRKLLTKPIPK
ncbi:hypothetical protein CAP35_04090 [Chitinophagaceae bacterium IBVUCB1]|nr:hypothetical protein CAP35_04090 [Chitinophagaceae bacterium IBVUCB1]